VLTGHVEKRAKSSWSLVIDLGRDPATGKRLRIRQSVKGVTKRQAEAELRCLIREIEQGTYVEPSKLTLGEYLQHGSRTPPSRGWPPAPSPTTAA